MLTQQQVSGFKTWAKKQGYSELEISQEIARKNQEITRGSVGANTGPASRVAAPISNAVTASQNPVVGQPMPQQKSFLAKTANATAEFFLPRTTSLTKRLSAAIDFNKEYDAADKANQKLFAQSQELYKKSRMTSDLALKRQYLAQAKEASQLIARNSDNLITKFEQNSGRSISQQEPGVINEAVGIAGEAGSYLIPAGKIVQGARLLKGAGLITNILRAGAEGALIGGLYGATTPEDITLQERGMRTAKGAATGGLVSGALQTAVAPLGLVKNLIKNNKSRIDRLFKINPSERIQFNKSTGGRDFAEELISKEGPSMAGKNYDELITHFSQRKKEVQNELNNVLSGRKETIDRKTLMSRIDTMIKGLRPEEGNVGQASSIAKLNTLLADIKKNPKNISLVTANKLKQQLQEMSTSAFSATGKSTPESKKLASLSSYVKDLIEEKVGDVDIKEQNFLIQLYDQAKRSIERVDAREANKVSSITKIFDGLTPAAGAIIGGSAAGVPGGIAGYVAGTLFSAGRTAAKERYISPEFQTKIVAAIENAAKNNGIRNADKLATTIFEQLRLAVARKASSNVADKSAQPTAAPSSITESILQEQPVESIDAVNNIPQEDPNEVVTIRNAQTGEEKQVSRSELSQYGLGTETNKQGAFPTKEDILMAMFVDIEKTGGKNLSKLNTILNAYNSIYEDKEKESDTTLELSDSAIKNVTDLQGALDDINMLNESIAKNDLVGPVRGLAAKNPYASESRILQARVDRVRQVIGKALEGGVLRKEDEEKYKKILPTLTDTKEVALDKLDQLEQKINSDLTTYIELQRSYGKGRGAENILNTPQDEVRAL